MADASTVVDVEGGQIHVPSSGLYASPRIPETKFSSEPEPRGKAEAYLRKPHPTQEPNGWPCTSKIIPWNMPVRRYYSAQAIWGRDVVAG